MDPIELVPGKTYITLDKVKACFYDEDDCLMPDAIDLPIDTDLTYVGPDAEDGYIFLTDEAEMVCLHLNDLDFINFAADAE